MVGKKDDRKHERIEIQGNHLQGKLSVLSGAGSQNCLISLKDFSKSGVGVYSKTQVPMQTRILITFEGSSFSPLEGRVVWSSQSSGDATAPQGYAYRLGIVFSPADDAARENQLAVYHYISQLAGSTR